MPSSNLAQSIEKLTKSGLKADEIPVGAVEILASMSDAELKALAEAQKKFSSGKVGALDFGTVIF